jgi:hypothetical protein
MNNKDKQELKKRRQKILKAKKKLQDWLDSRSKNSENVRQAQQKTQKRLARLEYNPEPEHALRNTTATEIKQLREALHCTTRLIDLYQMIDFFLEMKTLDEQTTDIQRSYLLKLFEKFKQQIGNCSEQLSLLEKFADSKRQLLEESSKSKFKVNKVGIVSFKTREIEFKSVSSASNHPFQHQTERYVMIFLFQKLFTDLKSFEFWEEEKEQI